MGGREACTTRPVTNEQARRLVFILSMFLTCYVADQIRLASEKFIAVSKRFKDQVLMLEVPMRGVAPLLEAVKKLRSSSKHLTALHPDFLQLCLLAKCYKTGLSILEDDIFEETLLVAREGRVWCLEDRLVLGGFDWDPTLQEKACWSRRPFDRVCMPLDKWRGDSDSDFEVFELFDPAVTGKVAGRISLSCSVEDPMETEKNFARRILAIVDYNEDGKLSFSEFSDLIKAFGNQVADKKKEELFKAVDKNGDDAASYGYELPQCQFYELSPFVVSSILMVALLYGDEMYWTKAFSESTGASSQSQPYMEVASSYSSGKVSELETYIQTNKGEDNNLGLVKQVISSMYKRNIQRLTQTYLTLSLQDIAKIVQLSSPKEAKMHVLQMVVSYAIILDAKLTAVL
ncbi:hypothetical protein POTOM_028288 [Populus tomentosa]|uniref:COP9 signalosome complex subunit 3 n=1 Tax=Populus tomentosa TaxID=118781 RepID=A0A8X8CUJ0_POPTO|nr:hypothetical protein POTOM_028288 [Populus tomentosa]